MKIELASKVKKPEPVAYLNTQGNLLIPIFGCPGSFYAIRTDGKAGPAKVEPYPEGKRVFTPIYKGDIVTLEF